LDDLERGFSGLVPEIERGARFGEDLDDVELAVACRDMQPALALVRSHRVGVRARGEQQAYGVRRRAVRLLAERRRTALANVARTAGHADALAAVHRDHQRRLADVAIR